MVKIITLNYLSLNFCDKDWNLSWRRPKKPTLT